MMIFVMTGCAPSVRYAHRSAKVKVTSNTGKPVVEQLYSHDDERLKTIVESYIGSPYAYAGLDRSGIDCSGLVCRVYREYRNLVLPHSAGKQFRRGKEVSRNAARMGDLVFFKQKMLGYIDHVGIYMGRGRFVHASTKLGVMYDSLDDEYYQVRFVGIKRLL